MTWALGAITLACWAVGTVRWLRVAQREHYLAGSCTRIAWLWMRRRPPNAIVGALAPVAAVVALAGPWPAVVVGAVLAAAFPVGMPVLGADRARIKVTRRVRTLGAVVAVLSSIVALAALLAIGANALAVVVVLVPMLMDAAAFLVTPLERRLSDRHRARAEAKLRAIGPRVVAITGSFGKTSTKNHLRTLIGDSVQTVASPASWNNTAGLSRAVNEHLSPGTEVFVAEMGTYGPGEIRDLCRWVRPEISVITAIGPAHLERMGSLDNILRAKSEILEGASVAVLNVGDPRLATLASTIDTALWRCAETTDTGLDVSMAPAEGSAHDVWVRGRHLGRVTLPVGVHASNVACAIGAAMALGLDASLVCRRLGSLAPAEHRATVGTSESGVVVIDDTFNSNPSGAAAALTQLREVGASGQIAVITPGMVELGAEQAPANEAFARSVVESGASLVVVGWTNRAALLRGVSSGGATLVRSRDAAREWVQANLGDGDAVLWENDLPDHYP